MSFLINPSRFGTAPASATGFPQTAAPTVSGFSGGASSHAATLPGSLSNGQLLLAWAGFFITNTDDILLPPGWTELTRGNQNIVAGKDVQLLLAARVVAGGEGSTVNFNTGAAANGAVQIYKITSWWGTIGTGISVGIVQSTGGTTPDPPSVTASWGLEKNLAITGGVAGDDDQAWTGLPTNYSNLVSTLSGGGANDGASVGTARREIEAASDNPSSFTLASSEGYVVQSVMIRPAAV